MARPTRPTTEIVPMMIGWSMGIAAQVSLPNISLLSMRGMIGAHPAAGNGFEEAIGDRGVGRGLDRLAWQGERVIGGRVERAALRLGASHPACELVGRHGGHLETHV